MNCLVLGAGGFIGGNLCKRLLSEGYTVIGVDIKRHEYFQEKEFCTYCVQEDLRTCDIEKLLFTFGPVDEVFQLAADMGGAGYIFTTEHDADIMHNSATINLRVLDACRKNGHVGRIFYSSSACVYNQDFQKTTGNSALCALSEDMAWPLNPDSDYGIEKGFSERLYKAFERNYGLQVRIARFHNIFGPYGSWNNGKEKAPAAICRKVAEAVYDRGRPLAIFNSIDIWGDGEQVRSFLYIDECVEGILRLMRSDCKEIVNIGSDEMITINDLAKMVIRISGKELRINNIPGPQGVRGRNSDNTLIQEKLGWKPNTRLEDGITKLYHWIEQEVKKGGL